MAGISSYFYQKLHDRKFAESICVAATAKVISFDPEKMTVNVQPLSKHLENGQYESQPPILQVPVVGTRSGGFITRPWFNAGDVGIVLYLDHDIDSTVSGGREAEPLTTRNHAPSDAVFLGGIVSGFSKSSKELPSESLVLCSETGTAYLAVTETGIEIAGNVVVKGNVTATGDVVAKKGVSLATHKHPVYRGGSTTEQPE